MVSRLQWWFPVLLMLGSACRDESAMSSTAVEEVREATTQIPTRSTSLLGPPTAIEGLQIDEVLVAYDVWRSRYFSRRSPRHKQARFRLVTRPSNASTTPTTIVSPEYLTPLAVSLTGLYRSDRLYTCRDLHSYTDFVVRLRADGQDRVVLSSTSSCDLHAPWNVEYEGQLFVQLDSSSASLLLGLLSSIDNRISSPRLESPLRFEWIDLLDGTPSPPGIKTAESPAARVGATVAADHGFQTRFPGLKPTVTSLWCNLEVHPDCSEAIANISVPLVANVDFNFQALIDANGPPSYELPADLALLQRFVKSPLVRAFMVLKPKDSIQVAYSQGPSSERVDVVPYFVAWVRPTVRFEKPPLIYFYPDQERGSLAPGDEDATRLLLNRLKVDDWLATRARKEGSSIRLRLDGTVYLSNSNQL